MKRASFFANRISIYALVGSFLVAFSVLHTKEQDYSGSSVAALAKLLSRAPSTILELRVDMHDCYDQRIRDPKELELFLTKVCARLKIADPGDSRVVVCDGSLMSGSAGCIFMHIADNAYIIGRVINDTNSVQLTLSCPMSYNTQEIADFAKKFFGASGVDVKVAIKK